MATAQVAPSQIPPITLCPPGAARNAKLDLFVGGAHRVLPVQEASFNADGDVESNGIDWSDYSRMQTQQHKLDSGRVAKANWTANDVMLRKALVRYLEVRANNDLCTQQPGSDTERLQRAIGKLNARKPSMEATLTRLAKRYVAMKRAGADVQKLGATIEGLDTELVLLKDNIAGKVLQIVHLYYRMGQNSVAVALEVGIKPPHVRALLMRIRRVASQLGFGEAPRRHGRRKVVVRAPAPLSPPTQKRLAIVSSLEFIALFEAARLRMADPHRKRCKWGHEICAANCHVGDLRRTGRYSCNECWREQARRYLSAGKSA